MQKPHFDFRIGCAACATFGNLLNATAYLTDANAIHRYELHSLHLASCSSFSFSCCSLLLPSALPGNLSAQTREQNPLPFCTALSIGNTYPYSNSHPDSCCCSGRPLATPALLPISDLLHCYFVVDVALAAKRILFIAPNHLKCVNFISIFQKSTKLPSITPLKFIDFPHSLPFQNFQFSYFWSNRRWLSWMEFRYVN